MSFGTWSPLSHLCLRLHVASLLCILYDNEMKKVPQSWLSLCDPINCKPPASSDRGILQARILEQVAVSFSRGAGGTGFLTQGSNVGLPYYRQSLYPLSHQGKPCILDEDTLQLTKTPESLIVYMIVEYGIVEYGNQQNREAKILLITTQQAGLLQIHGARLSEELALCPTQSLELAFLISPHGCCIPILQMSKWRLREIKINLSSSASLSWSESRKLHSRCSHQLPSEAIQDASHL